MRVIVLGEHETNIWGKSPPPPLRYSDPTPRSHFSRPSRVIVEGPVFRVQLSSSIFDDGCILYFPFRSPSGTIRRFLEKHGESFETIVLTMMGVDEVRIVKSYKTSTEHLFFLVDITLIRGVGAMRVVTKRFFSNLNKVRLYSLFCSFSELYFETLNIVHVPLISVKVVAEVKT